MAGMTISTSGVLLRAAERLEKTRDSKSTGFMLRELYRHLKMLNDDPTMHARFFELYVDLDEPTRDTHPGSARD